MNSNRTEQHNIPDSSGGSQLEWKEYDKRQEKERKIAKATLSDEAMKRRFLSDFGLR